MSYTSALLLARESIATEAIKGNPVKIDELAYKAGRMTYRGGVSLDTIWRELMPDIEDAGHTWSRIVDGYFSWSDPQIFSLDELEELMRKEQG